MLYTLLCYNSEDMVFSWSQEEDDAVMERLHQVHGKLHSQGKLGPSLRLMATTTAATLRKSDPPVVVDVENLDEALAIAKDLGQANPGGSYEIRPVRLFLPGSLPQSAQESAAEAATEDA